jgi:hypothetical protein
MNITLQAIKDYEKNIQDSIQSKLANGQPLTDADVKNYILQDEDIEVMNILNKVMGGESVSGFRMQDFLSTPQAKTLIPRVIIGAMKRAAEPMYMASQFYKPVKYDQGKVVIFPSIGAMRAFDVAEAQEIPAANIDWQTHKNNQIYIGRSGLRLQFDEDVIKQNEFDLMSIMLQEAGRAMARLKEEKAFNEFMSHGWVVFDNNYADPQAKTTGIDYNGVANLTLSVEDLLELLIAVYNNEYVPTDLIMHPLAWTVFARNGLTGAFTSSIMGKPSIEGVNGKYNLGPESIQGRIPFAFNVNLSPFAPIDKDNKTFDIITVDKNNVGVQIVQEGITTTEWIDPSRDLKNIKMIEKYGYGTFNEGRAVAIARNISMEKSYPAPERTHNI